MEPPLGRCVARANGTRYRHVARLPSALVNVFNVVPRLFSRRVLTGGISMQLREVF